MWVGNQICNSKLLLVERKERPDWNPLLVLPISGWIFHPQLCKPLQGEIRTVQRDYLCGDGPERSEQVLMYQDIIIIIILQLNYMGWDKYEEAFMLQRMTKFTVATNQAQSPAVSVFAGANRSVTTVSAICPIVLSLTTGAITYLHVSYSLKL